MTKEINNFLQQLHAEIQDRMAQDVISGEKTYSETVFTDYILDSLAELGVTGCPELCDYEGRLGRGLVKINGFSLDEERGQLDLFVSHYIGGESINLASKPEMSKLALKAYRFFEASLGEKHASIEPSTTAAELAQQIHVMGDGWREVRIFVLTDGQSQAKSLDLGQSVVPSVHCEIWDIERLHRGLQAGLPRDEIIVDFEMFPCGALPCITISGKTRDYTAYFTIMPGEVLSELYKEYNARLLELNVRSFLSIRGQVNKGIRKTIHEEPEKFLAYNNGIVVTVDGMLLGESESGQTIIKKLTGFQIVNGGQTTASIHRAQTIDKIDISDVMVPTKIIAINANQMEEMVPRISRNANTQNTVQLADFSANDPYHVEMERLSNTIWCPDQNGRWFYERSRGQYQVAKMKVAKSPAQTKKFNKITPTVRKFVKTDLAKYINSWEQKPHQVSFGAQKNFNFFMQSLRNGRAKDWLPDDDYYREFIAMAILFKETYKIVRKIHFPSGMTNITAYTVSYLSWRTGGNLDLLGIWQSQRLSEGLQDLLTDWAKKMYDLLHTTAKGRMITEWAKKEKAWEAAKGLEVELPDPLPREMSERVKMVKGGGGKVRVQEELSPEDFRNIETCKNYDGEQWLRMHAWGLKTGGLTRKHIGVAHTLSGYAASGWLKGPSRKQAYLGVQIINLYLEAQSE